MTRANLARSIRGSPDTICASATSRAGSLTQMHTKVGSCTERGWTPIASQRTKYVMDAVSNRRPSGMKMSAGSLFLPSARSTKVTQPKGAYLPQLTPPKKRKGHVEKHHSQQKHQEEPFSKRRAAPVHTRRIWISGSGPAASGTDVDQPRNLAKTVTVE